MAEERVFKSKDGGNIVIKRGGIFRLHYEIATATEVEAGESFKILIAPNKLMATKEEMFELAENTYYIYNLIKENEIEAYNQNIIICENAEKARRDSYTQKPKSNPTIIPRYVYLMKSENLYKIGISKDPAARANELRSWVPYEIEIIAMALFDKAKYHEDVLHEAFKDKRANGEWFNLDESDVDFIINDYFEANKSEVNDER